MAIQLNLVGAKAQVPCDGRSGFYVVRGPVGDSQDCLEWEKAPTVCTACVCVVCMHKPTLLRVQMSIQG